MKNSLKVERAKLGYTQQVLATKVQVSRQTINAIEKGDYNLSLILALKIAATFKCQTEDIFELEFDDWE